MNLNRPIPPRILLALGLSIPLVLCQYLLQSRIGYNMYDEGFLWYGAQGVMRGEVPMRDFMAYEPLRYYCDAAFLLLFQSHGLVACRAGMYFFEWIGVFLALLTLIRRAARPNVIFPVLAAITVMFWTAPHHKVYDLVATIALIWAFSEVIENPSNRNLFVAGLVLGLAASMGKNHGLYGAVGGVMVLLYLRFNLGEKPMARRVGLAALGTVLGYLPVIMMLVLVPGFAAAFLRSITILFENGSTNIGMPVPWPWEFKGTGQQMADLSQFFTGCLFVALLAWLLLGMYLLVRPTKGRRPANPALVASAFLGLPYAHYAFSRADLTHLALGIFPLVIGSLAWLNQFRGAWKIPAAAVTAALSGVTIAPKQPGIDGGYKFVVWTKILDDDILLDPGNIQTLASFQDLINKYSPNVRLFFVTPLWPGVYSAFDRKAPVWEIYALFPRSDAFQQAEIERLRRNNPGFAVIIRFELDGKTDTYFEYTNPLIYKYVRSHFRQIQYKPFPPPTYQVFVKDSK